MKNSQSHVANSKQTVMARSSFTRHSPRKMRLVADAVRGLAPLAAIARLETLPHRAAKTLLKTYKQAMGNAVHTFKLNPGELIVSRLLIEEGPRGPKRADVHSHGARFGRGIRRKRMAHIRIELQTKS